jgi:hypothetical protein
MMAASADPVFLQIKEARKSVLEPYAGKSVYENSGERVVTGQRIMQSASDIFLGWSDTKAGRHFYVRQLNDAKLKPLVEIFDETTMEDYGRLCGWVLAQAHARSGDASMISGYLGSNDVLTKQSPILPKLTNARMSAITRRSEERCARARSRSGWRAEKTQQPLSGNPAPIDGLTIEILRNCGAGA